MGGAEKKYDMSKLIESAVNKNRTQLGKTLGYTGLGCLAASVPFLTGPATLWKIGTGFLLSGGVFGAGTVGETMVHPSKKTKNYRKVMLME